MVKVIGVSFRGGGKVYYFSTENLPVKRGLHVIVETARGTEFGTAVGEIKEIDEAEFSAPIKPILRIATKRDEEQEAANREKEMKAIRICKEKILEHKLDMKLIGAEYTFDSSKVLFYFTADGRVDFRELVKDLAGVFRTRIELRQIGVRDETKVLGGIGVCGRPLCCHIYLSDFAPVSIKMAKEQNLSLNPTKISGVCGRLMCCLKNEEDTYEYLNRLMPGVGDPVVAKTEDGEVEGSVHSINVLRQTVKVIFDDEDGDREIKEFKVEDLTFEPRKGGKNHKKRKNNNDKKQEPKDQESREEKELEKLVEADEEDYSRQHAEEGQKDGGRKRDFGRKGGGRDHQEGKKNPQKDGEKREGKDGGKKNQNRNRSGRRDNRGQNGGQGENKDQSPASRPNRPHRNRPDRRSGGQGGGQSDQGGSKE